VSKLPPILALIAALLLAGSPCPQASERAYRMRTIEDRVLEAVQARRTEAAVAPLQRRASLDRVARARAERLAALPDGRRLSTPWFLEDELETAGVTGWRRAYRRQAVLTGPRPVERLVEQWSRLPEAWNHAMASGTSGVGVGGAHAPDGTFVFAAVLVVDLAWPDDPETFERRVHEAVNKVRREHGLGMLAYDPALAAVARAHSRAMRDDGFFDHSDPTGARAGERVAVAGIPYRSVAENLSYTQRVEDPVARAVSNWLESPGHRANLLGADYRRTGVGVAVSDAGEVWVTQLYLGPGAFATDDAP
jgi:uncharacterized protein YkwD